MIHVWNVILNPSKWFLICHITYGIAILIEIVTLKPCHCMGMPLINNKRVAYIWLILIKFIILPTFFKNYQVTIKSRKGWKKCLHAQEFVVQLNKTVETYCYFKVSRFCQVQYSTFLLNILSWFNLSSSVIQFHCSPVIFRKKFLVVIICRNFNH